VDILRIRTRNMAVDPALDLDALAALVRSPHLPFHRTWDAIHDFWLFGSFGTDERVLGRRTRGYMPRGRINRHARRYKYNIRESLTYLRGALISISKFL